MRFEELFLYLYLYGLLEPRNVKSINLFFGIENYYQQDKL